MVRRVDAGPADQPRQGVEGHADPVAFIIVEDGRDAEHASVVPRGEAELAAVPCVAGAVRVGDVLDRNGAQAKQRVGADQRVHHVVVVVVLGVDGVQITAQQEGDLILGDADVPDDFRAFAPAIGMFGGPIPHVSVPLGPDR